LQDANVIGSVNTAYTVGCVISGFFVSAPISNYIGRRYAMMIGCLLVIIASFLAAFSPRNIGAFIGAKALVGIGQGITLPAGPVYISEITPSKTRGAVMSFWQLFLSVGNFMGFWIAFACSKNTATLGNWDWKIVMLCQNIAPTFIVSSLWPCPESPRWYIQKDRPEEAVAALMQIRNSREEVDTEIEQIQLAVCF
jgi:MFS family permease